MTELQKTIRALSHEERTKKAAAILIETKSGMQQVVKMNYLIDHCGLTMNEYLEALNYATGGALVNDALSGCP